MKFTNSACLIEEWYNFKAALQTSQLFTEIIVEIIAEIILVP